MISTVVVLVVVNINLVDQIDFNLNSRACLFAWHVFCLSWIVVSNPISIIFHWNSNDGHIVNIERRYLRG